MREVIRDRFVSESPEPIRRIVTPERIVEWEGSFSVTEVTDADDHTFVDVSGPGVRFRLRFEPTEDGYHYNVTDNESSAGPFDHFETWITITAENEGSRVRFRSVVSLNAPLPFADRIGAWKRGGELNRALDGLVEAL